jgi:prepilin-type processing-associated H-X9-DG protein
VIEVHRKGFSMIELVIVIGIIMIVMGLLVPAISRARNQAIALKCQAQLQQIGQALEMYASENQGAVFPLGGPFSTVPNSHSWPAMLFGTLNSPIVVCPTSNGEDWVSYQLNFALYWEGIRLGAANRQQVSSSNIVVAGENPVGGNELVSDWGVSGIYSFDPIRHGAILKSNYLWLDFHVSNDPPHTRSEADWYPWAIE